MICRNCIQRAAAHGRRSLIQKAPATRFLSTTSTPQQAAAASPASTASATATDEPPARSTCPEGTVLTGLNYFKGKTDPVALPDSEYPEWLWSCMDVMKKSGGTAESGAGDEFSKSKKQRRIAMKRARTVEAKLIASGDLEALAPKIPLQHQSINLPGSPDGTLEENVAAIKKRDELRKAMRSERKAKIKEDNYLKSM